MLQVSRRCREDIVAVVLWSQLFEKALVDHCGAINQGGLRDRLESVRGSVPDDVARNLKYIAGERNRVVHEIDATINDLEKFNKTCLETEKRFKELFPKEESGWGCLLVVLIIIAVVIGIWAATS